MLFGTIRPPAIRHAKPAMVWLRVGSSCAWIAGARDAFAARFAQPFAHGALDSRIAHLLSVYVAPHFVLVAALSAGTELAVGISLALGIFTRLGGALAIVCALATIAVAGGRGADTIGFNAMLVIAAALCVWTGAGRQFGFDAGLIDRFPKAGVLRLVA